MSDSCLLDANVLIALVIEEHEFHVRAHAWAGSRPIAVCPIVEGALVRYLIRVGESTHTVAQTLRAVRQRCDFWADDLSYAEIELQHLAGHRQVTDTYLAALARNRGARLATFDQGLRETHPDVAIAVD